MTSANGAISPAGQGECVFAALARATPRVSPRPRDWDGRAVRSGIVLIRVKERAGESGRMAGVRHEGPCRCGKVIDLAM